MSDNYKNKSKKKIIIPAVSATATVVAVAAGMTIYNVSNESKDKPNQIEESVNGKDSNKDGKELANNKNDSSDSLQGSNNSNLNEGNKTNSGIDKPNAELNENSIGDNGNNSGLNGNSSGQNSNNSGSNGSDMESGGDNSNGGIEDNISSEDEVITIDKNQSLDNIPELISKVFEEDGIDIVNNTLEVDYSEVNIDIPGMYKVRAVVRNSNGDIISQRMFTIKIEERETNVTLKGFEGSKKYLNKKEAFNIDLELSISKKNVSAESVTINGEEYPVTKVKNRNALSKTKKYKVELNAEDIAGVKEYKITQVKMSDGTKFNVTGSISVEVIKDEAKTSNFTFEDLGESDKLKVKFDLEDKDSSITELRGILYDLDGNEVERKILQVNDKNEVEFENVPGNNTYTFKVFADMDLDSDMNNKKNEIRDKELLSEEVVTKKTVLEGKNITILEGQAFDAKTDLVIKATDKDGNDITDKVTISSSNVDIHTPGEYKVVASVTNSFGTVIEKEFTVRVEKANTNVTLDEFKVDKKYLNKKESFEADLELNISKKYVYAKSVIINGVEYPLTQVKSRNAFSKTEKYKVELNAEDAAGVKDYEITQVEMSDGTKFNVKGNISIDVKKDEAKASNFTFEDLGESDKLKVKFDLDDKDSSVTELRGILYDEQGNEIKKEKIIANTNNEIEFDNVPGNNTYKFKVFADMDLDSDSSDNENKVKNKELLSETAATKKTVLEGKNITILEGQAFDAKTDLAIKATDKDGNDITDKVTISGSNVDIHVPGEYKVIASVTNSLGNVIEKEFIVTVEKANTNVTLAGFESSKKYLDKQEKFDVDLELNISKKYVYAESITINGVEYSVTKVKSRNAFSKTEKYTVELNAEDTAGIKNYEITQVKMSDGTKFNVTGNISIDVKKDEAKATNFTFEDLGESDKLKVRFDLDDRDSSVTELRGVLYNEKGEEIQNKTLTANDKNEVEFENVPGNNTYKFKVFADMDLDSDSSDNENKVTSKELLSGTAVTKKTVIEGRNITILEGQDFDAKRDLEIKGTDKDGNDITDKVTISSSNVDIHTPGEYKVVASVKNSLGNVIEKEFTVTVEKANTNVTLAGFESSKKYLDKQEKFDVDLELNISKKYVYAKSVIINGVEYPLTQVKSRNAFSKTEKYKVELNAEDAAGVKDYEITQVEMSDGTKFNVTGTVSVDVKKDEAKASNFDFEDLGESDKLKVKFDLDDRDSSVTELRGVLYNEKGEEIQNKTLTANDKNEVEFENVPGNNTYKFKVFADMDLDSDSSDNENKVTSKELLSGTAVTKKTVIEGRNITILEGQSFNAKTDLDIKATDKDGNDITSTVTVDDSKVDIHTPGEYKVVASVTNSLGDIIEKEFTVTVEKANTNVTLAGFESSKKYLDKQEKFDVDLELNISKKYVYAESVTINGVEYSVTKVKSRNAFSKTEKYKVELNAEDAAGVKDYEITQVEMSDGTKFNVTGNISIDVKKEEAKASNFTFEDLGESDKLKVKFDLDDKDSSVTGLRGILYDAQGKEIQNKALTANTNNEVEFDNVPGNNTYTFKVFADMDLDSNVSDSENKVDNKELLSQTVSTKKTVIEGKDVIILEGEYLDAKTDLAITATDKDGKDITNDVIVDASRVDIHKPGDYKVIASVINTAGNKIEKEFNVKVQETIVKADIKKFESNATYLKRDSEFEINLDLEISKKYVSAQSVTINGTEYNLVKTRMGNFFSKDERYKIEMTSENSSGVKDYNITQIRMTDGTLVKVNETLKVEVLKVEASADSIVYEDLGEHDKVKINFNLNDPENSITELKGVICNLDGTEIESKTLSQSNGLNSVEFYVPANKTYKFKLLANMDLDTNTITNNENEVSNVELLVQDVTTSKKRIELKDVEGVQVYQEENGVTKAVDIVDVSQDLDISKFFVEIKQKDMPILMAPLKNYTITNNDLEFTVDYPNLVSTDENGDLIEGFKFKYNSKNGNDSYIQNIQGLRALIYENLSGTVTLTKDIDASYYSDVTAIIPDDFSGTIEGNGHKIYNLKVPFFAKIKNATIKNLIFDNVNISTGAAHIGALAKASEGSRIEDVHVKGKLSGGERTGGLVGDDVNSTIKASSANIDISVGSVNVGGLVGRKDRGLIENSYAIGKLLAAPESNAANVGGLVGNLYQGEIVNCFSGVDVESKNANQNVGGLVGSSYIRGLTRDSISLSSVTNGYKIEGTADKFLSRNSYRNVYEYEDAKGESNHKFGQTVAPGIKLATKANKENKSFYTNSVNFKEDIWNLDGVSSGEYPTLKNNDPRNKTTYSVSSEKTKNKVERNIGAIQNTIQSEGLYIPNIERIATMPEFDENKLKAYNNIYKLMPHYESENIVRYGNNIDASHELNTKVIEAIIPLKDSDIQFKLTTENYNDINKILVVYKDKSKSEFNVTLDKFRTENSLADYKVDNLGIIYTPNRFVTKVDEAIVSDLESIISNMTFEEVLNNTVGGRYVQSKAYTIEGDRNTWYDLDWYLLDDTYESIKKDSLENLHELLSTVDVWNITSSNNLINNKIKEEVKKEVATALLAKSYIDKWYDVDIGDIKLSEIMYSYPEVFGDADTSRLISTFKSINRDHLKSNATGTFYRQYLSGILDYKKVDEFVAGAIKIFDGADDPRDWFVNNFAGYITEVPSKVKPDLPYRAWDSLVSNKEFSDGSMLLPMLILKDKSVYIVSTVGPMSVGVRTNYSEDEAGFEYLMKSVPSLYGRYFDSILSVANNADKNIFKFPSWDTLRQNNKYTNLKDTTDEGINKLYKSMRILPHPNAGAISTAGAYATGSSVRFMLMRQLSTGNIFNAWTHENAHNMDGSVYLGGHGRRQGLEPEDFARGFFEEEDPPQDNIFIRDDYYIGWNWSVERTLDGSGIRNASPDRVDTQQELKDYMQGVMDAVYVIDLIEAEAVLSLTPAEQSKILHQYEYGKINEYSLPENQRSRNWAHMRSLSEDEIKAMNLRTYEDLVENKIVIERTEVYKDVKPADYKGFSLMDTGYYHGFVEDGRPETRSLKRMAMELLAEKGWTDGVEGYMSNKLKMKNDLDILNSIYNTTNFDFKAWKKELFKRRADKLKAEGVKFVNIDEVKQQFIEAYKNDVYNLKRASGDVRANVFKKLKNGTNDFTTSIFGTTRMSNNEDLNKDTNEENKAVDELEKLSTDIAEIDNTEKTNVEGGNNSEANPEDVNREDDTTSSNKDEDTAESNVEENNNSEGNSEESNIEKDNVGEASNKNRSSISNKFIAVLRENYKKVLYVINRFIHID